jgi:hypothetical protein
MTVWPLSHCEAHVGGAAHMPICQVVDNMAAHHADVVFTTAQTMVAYCRVDSATLPTRSMSFVFGMLADDGCRFIIENELDKARGV